MDTSALQCQTLWTIEQTERRLGHALNIAEQAVDCLATTGYRDREESANDIRPEKVISETAFLLLGASTVRNLPGIAARVGTLAEKLAPHARGERMVLGMCFEPSLTLDFALAHICLSRMGMPDPPFDACLRQGLHSQARNGHERTPYRELEQAWLKRAWAGPRPASDQRVQRLARRSALGRSFDPLSGSRENVYAFTHALLYVRDFNIDPLPLPRSTEDILLDAEAAVARCLEEEDYDLCGEVLLAWPLTGTPWSPIASFACQVLARIEDEAGFLPSPATRVERVHQLEDRERREYLLATAYHTAYVMGLLCAAALQPGNQPPDGMPRCSPRPRASRRLLPHQSEQRRHWRDDFDRLSPSEQDGLADLIFATAVYRRTRNRDFAGLREVLAIGYDEGLVATPMASHAAEMLERLAVSQPALRRR